MTYAFKDIGSAESRAEALTVEETPPVLSGFYRDRAKRLLDLFLVVLSAPFTLSLVLAGAAAAALDGHSPFYTQKRVGRGGREFRILKLRTMVPDADARLERHLAESAEARREWDEHQKLTNDPRITTIGRILRKTSMDELPQLWNVLKGDMSLVGPRPMMVEQKDMYPGKAYYLQRPGITGLWQVSDRHATSFRARASYDAQYNMSLSFVTDVKIIWRTFSVVLRGTGC